MYNQNIGKVVSVDNATATLEALVDLQMLVTWLRIYHFC